ncbi:MAG: metallophosphoesterase [Neisseria sp.]|nr:metallophosphoesterase [Neisseria sp.]
MFFIVFLFGLQLLSYACARSLHWLAGDALTLRAKRRLSAIIFIVSNVLLLNLLLRLWHGAFHSMAMWLIFMLYTVYAVIAAGVLYLLLRRIAPRSKPLPALRAFALLFFIGLSLFSLHNAYVPTVRHYRITLDKPLAQPLRIGVASDLHLGKWFGKRQLDQLAAIMQQEKADLILLPGDIMDDNVIAYRAKGMQEHFSRLRAPLGVYATLGNHDLFGHQHEITAEIRAAGIELLHDDVVQLPQGITLIGRPDNMDKQRRSTAELLAQVDTSRPVIVLDHRPDHIEQHARLPVDIQVSGHAHNGQIFPANLIVRAINRLAYGHEKIGNGHFFVTSGYGFWAVPLRLGSQSEVMMIEVTGKTNEKTAGE